MGVVMGDGEQRAATDDVYIVSVLLLCVTCQQPIKAWINSPQWIRCEWISPTGECQACWNKAKEERNVPRR